MAKQRTFRVRGKWQGRPVDIEVQAFSKKQAEFIASFDFGVPPNEKGKFARSVRAVPI